MDEEEKEFLIETLLNRNGMVVEYNPMLTAILGCNTNVSILRQRHPGQCYPVLFVELLQKYLTTWQNACLSYSTADAPQNNINRLLMIPVLLNVTRNYSCTRF